MNGWQDDDKAVFLATALEGRAAMVLGSLSDKERRDYNKLVTALTVRFGMAHQSELARAKLKCRSRGKEESIPELAESVETLTRAAYPDASSDLQDIIENFIDALLDEDIRLKVRQARPQSLQAALESTMETLTPCSGDQNGCQYCEKWEVLEWQLRAFSCEHSIQL